MLLWKHCQAYQSNLEGGVPVDNLLAKLQGGDRRSIGRVDEVVREVLADPSLFRLLFEGMLHEDPLIRMRAADAPEKDHRTAP